ncbi:MAG: SH3 domain-containing protein [Mesorhizobium sp.]|nr:MAG: SH3 domain-containing protein [Mesorhizobium sp.]
MFSCQGACGDDAESADTPLTPADMGGTPPAQQAEGSCGEGAATVVINQPGLDKLNVRSGPGGQVIGTVPEGETVSVIGPCGSVSGAAGFAKPKTQQGGGGGGAGGWCQISAPAHGCVSAQFLAFGGGDVDQPGGAAGFAKPKGKHQALASATASFGGSWSANADNVAYSLSLKQNGNGVSGRYQGDDGSAGKITGKVSGNILRFAWVQTDGTKGSGKFMLSGDGRSFTGSYSFGNDPDAVEGSWNGTRQ